MIEKHAYNLMYLFCHHFKYIEYWNYYYYHFITFYLLVYNTNVSCSDDPAVHLDRFESIDITMINTNKELPQTDKSMITCYKLDAVL